VTSFQVCACCLDWCVLKASNIMEKKPSMILLIEELNVLCSPAGLSVLVKAQHYLHEVRWCEETQTAWVNSVGSWRFPPPRPSPQSKNSFEWCANRIDAATPDSN